MIFSSIFLLAVTFSHVLHLNVVRSQIELKLKTEIFMYGYNAEQPIAISSTVLCDVHSTMIHTVLGSPIRTSVDRGHTLKHHHTISQIGCHDEIMLHYKCRLFGM